MLVTFRTNAYSDITMFGTAAVSLLKLMGQSGNVPGAIMADDVPKALNSLREGLAQLSEEQASSEEPADNHSNHDDNHNHNRDEEIAIGLDKRAGPLVSLLEAAVEANENVLWNE